MIRFTNATHRVVQTSDGETIVITERRPNWWVQAPADVTEKVLAGLRRPVLRVIEGGISNVYG